MSKRAKNELSTYYFQSIFTFIKSLVRYIESGFIEV